jgi:hypothetical protein
VIVIERAIHALTAVDDSMITTVLDRQPVDSRRCDVPRSRRTPMLVMAAFDYTPCPPCSWLCSGPTYFVRPFRKLWQWRNAIAQRNRRRANHFLIPAPTLLSRFSTYGAIFRPARIRLPILPTAFVHPFRDRAPGPMVCAAGGACVWSSPRRTDCPHQAVSTMRRSIVAVHMRCLFIG